MYTPILFKAADQRESGSLGLLFKVTRRAVGGQISVLGARADIKYFPKVITSIFMQFT